MRKTVRYVIFPTKWGYFGFSGGEKGLLRTCLPASEYEEIEVRLLANSPLAQFNRQFFQETQDWVAAYFNGEKADLGLETPIDLTGLTPFQRKVLTACRRVGLAKTTTYGRLAAKIGNPQAARAVGNALANNPLPLIIPCHRILAANNSLGGFSAPGGTQLKARMLRHEQSFGH